MKTKQGSRYCVHAFPTNRYDRSLEVTRGFKSVEELWKWCREYLSTPGRKVVAYGRTKGRMFGLRATRIRKIGEFTTPGEIPGA